MSLTDAKLAEYETQGAVVIDSPLSKTELDRAELAWDRWQQEGAAPRVAPGAARRRDVGVGRRRRAVGAARGRRRGRGRRPASDGDAGRGAVGRVAPTWRRWTAMTVL